MFRHTGRRSDQVLPDEHQVKLLEALLSEAHADVDRADFKASLLTGSLGVVFTGLVIFSANGQVRLAHVAIWVWVGGVIAAGAASFFGGLSIWPRTVQPAPYFVGDPVPDDVKKEEARLPLVRYWREAAGIESIRLLRAALQVDRDGYVDRAALELSRLSRTIEKKYWSVRWSIRAAGVAVILIAIAPIVSLLLPAK